MGRDSAGLLLILLGGLVGCRGTARPITGADRAAVRRFDSLFAAAANAGDVDGMMAGYAPDAILLPPNDPTIRGSDGIRRQWTDLAASGGRLEQASETVEGAGEVMYATGTYRYRPRLTDSTRPAPPASVGKYLYVFRRQADGRWKVVVDAWNATAPSRDSCADLLVGYADWPTVRDRQWEVRTRDSVSGGALLFLGVERHTSEPADGQVARIISASRSFRPTVAVYEGSDHEVARSVEESVRRFGEPGLVRHLAAQARTPAGSLEPGRDEEVRSLLRHFSAERLTLFYVLRSVAQSRERQGADSLALRRVAEEGLASLSEVPGLESVVRSVSELAAAYRRHWPSGPPWWLAPIEWFTPLRAASETGGIFTNDLNRASSQFRDRHMYELLVERVRRGEQVLAVVGRNHVAMQAAALRCALPGTPPARP